MEDESSKPSDDTTSSTTVRRKSKPQPTTCKICQASALYSYFGAIVCHSCRKFFRRNAHKKLNDLKCFYDGHCEVHTTDPRMCAYCRLVKCFANQMQPEMIRFSRTTTKTRREKTLENTIAKIVARLKEKTVPEQFPTLNLLQSDQSTLTIEQWDLLSNLTHCYNESSGLSYTQCFIKEQNRLPPRIRYKLSSVDEYFTAITDTCPFLYEKNYDFISLCSHDRSILLHNTMKYVASLCACFITYHSRLLDNLAFYKSAELVYGSDSMATINRVISQIDSDSTFFKLALAILTFSTYNYTYYSNTAPYNLINIKSILHIQDIYTELAWRYLVYTYGHWQAVMCFSNLMRCLFLLNQAVIEATPSKQYTDMIDSLIKQTEERLTLTE